MQGCHPILLPGFVRPSIVVAIFEKLLCHIRRLFHASIGLCQELEPNLGEVRDIFVSGKFHPADITQLIEEFLGALFPFFFIQAVPELAPRKAMMGWCLHRTAFCLCLFAEVAIQLPLMCNGCLGSSVLSFVLTLLAYKPSVRCVSLPLPSLRRSDSGAALVVPVRGTERAETG